MQLNLDLAKSKHLALIDAATRQQLTYGELLDAAAKKAAELRQDRRQLIFVFMENSIPAVAAYLAATASNAAVALFDAGLGPEVKQRLIEHYLPDIIFDGNQWQIFRRDLREPHPDLAILLSTSGSTGNPKLVRLSQVAIKTNAVAIAEYLQLSDDERAFLSLPLSYSYGLSVLNSHLHSGATVILAREGVMSRAFFSQLRDSESTSLAGVPQFYRMLDRLRFDANDYPCLRYMTQAGGHLEESIVSKFASSCAQNGRRFYVMYGQTEATARISFVPPAKLIQKVGSAGIAVPGGIITLHNVGSYATPELGEVVYRGPNVMMGYASSREDLAKDDELKGTLHTGDLGVIDTDGFLYIKGRLKRFAKVFGSRLNLDDIQIHVATKFPNAAIAHSEKVVLFCERITTEDAYNLKLELAKIYQLHHSGFEVRELAALPLNANGKINYASLERLL